MAEQVTAEELRALTALLEGSHADWMAFPEELRRGLWRRGLVVEVVVPGLGKSHGLSASGYAALGESPPA